MNSNAMNSYCTLLAEIKLRHEAIQRILEGKVLMRAKIAEESCYLQLRMMCELIAMGCLILHESLKPKNALFKTYKASWIMKELEKIHPKFYPQPLTSKDGVGDDGTPKMEPKEGGYLTMTELSQLWKKYSGDMLHRGSTRNILEKERPLKFEEISGWNRKILELLNRHIVMSRDGSTFGYFYMEHAENGQPGWQIFEAIE
jgi:hypothetical protein